MMVVYGIVCFMDYMSVIQHKLDRNVLDLNRKNLI